MPSLSALVSSSFVASRNNASGAWYLIPARYTSSKSNSDSRSCSRASWFVECAKLRICVNASWSVRMVNRWPSKNRRKKKMAFTIARYLFWVVSLHFSLLVRERGKFPSYLAVSSGYFCSKTRPIWTMHGSVSSIMCPLKLCLRQDRRVYQHVFEGFHAMKIIAMKRCKRCCYLFSGNDLVEPQCEQRKGRIVERNCKIQTIAVVQWV